MIRLSLDRIDQGAQPAYLSNGVVGLRVPPVPYAGGTCVVNGHVGLHETQRVQAMAYAPYPLGGDIRIGHLWLSRRPELARFRAQTYDLSCGELSSSFDYETEDGSAAVEVLTFCSRTAPTLVLQETKVTVDRPCTVILRAQVEPQGVDGRCAYRTMSLPENGEAVDGCIRWESAGALSELGIAYVSSCRSDGGHVYERRKAAWGEASAIQTAYVIEAVPGETYRLQQIACCVPSLMHSEPDYQAVRLTYLGVTKGFETLREENRQAWKELWKGRLKLLGADRAWQDRADAAYFYLHTSIHPSSPNSTALFGLGQWRNYHGFLGHIFWDIETFTFPPLLLTQPHAARAILDYRSGQLEAARRNAAMNGYRGIQFPWESSTKGEEVTPPGYPQSVFEHHVTLDIAIAFAQYAHATGDSIFAKEQAWPLLKGVAEWLESRVTETGRGYEIHGVTGIDEGKVAVNNNAWTNSGALASLREAIAMARRMGYEPPASWADMADRLYLPVDPASRVLLQYDGFRYRDGEIVCPDSLFAFFPHDLEVPPGVKEATLRHYLEWGRAALGYPMHSPLQGVWAAMTGDRALSGRRFEMGFGDFVFDPYLLIDEFSVKFTRRNKERVGPYLAHAGGFLMACMFGLTGLRIQGDDPDGWFRHPVVMPDLWDGVEVERIWVRGKPAALRAVHGDAKGRILCH